MQQWRSLHKSSSPNQEPQTHFQENVFRFNDWLCICVHSRFLSDFLAFCTVLRFSFHLWTKRTLNNKYTIINSWIASDIFTSFTAKSAETFCVFFFLAGTAKTLKMISQKKNLKVRFCVTIFLFSSSSWVLFTREWLEVVLFFFLLFKKFRVCEKLKRSKNKSISFLWLMVENPWVMKVLQKVWLILQSLIWQIKSSFCMECTYSYLKATLKLVNAA